MLWAQRIEIGVTAGVPVTETVDRGNLYRTGVEPATRHYTFGPAVELRLAGPLSARFDALYQRVSFHQAAFSKYVLDSTTTGSLWQFPFLLKCRIPAGRLNPFVTAGPSFQKAANMTRTAASAFGSSAEHPTPEPGTIAGITAGAGVDIVTGRLRIHPEVRYTRWGEHIVLTDLNGVRTKLGQLQILVGIGFPLGSR